VAIETNDLRVVISDDIRREWKEQASKYSWFWFVNMVSRNRHWSVDPVPDVELRRAIDKLVPDDRAAAQKDLLLIEAALDDGGRVISRDKEMHRILRGVARELPKVGAVHWVLPEQDKCLPWLAAGAPNRPDLQLMTRSKGRS